MESSGGTSTLEKKIISTTDSVRRYPPLTFLFHVKVDISKRRFDLSQRHSSATDTNRRKNRVPMKPRKKEKSSSCPPRINRPPEIAQQQLQVADFPNPPPRSSPRIRIDWPNNPSAGVHQRGTNQHFLQRKVNQHSIIQKRVRFNFKH